MKYKYSFNKRIISVLLAFAMVMGCYICDVKPQRVYASSSNAAGELEGDVIYLSSSDGQPAEFVMDRSAGNKMDYYTSEGVQTTSSDYYQLVITSPLVTVKVINGHCDSNLEIMNESGGTVLIDDAISVDGSVLFYESTIDFIGGDADITGTVSWPIHVTSGDVTIQSSGRLTGYFNVEDGTLTNYGTVAMDTIAIEDLDGITSTESAIYEATTAFYNDINLLGTVRVQNDTYLELTGGKCTIELPNGISKTFTPSYENSVTGTAYDAIMVDPEISLAAVGDIYYGTEPDFSDKVSVDADYTGEVYFEYKGPGDSEFSTDPIDSIGNWQVRAVAPEDGEYARGVSATRSFRVSYLPLSEVAKAEESSYLKLSHLTNGKYTQDYVTVSPASGYKVKTYMGGSEYAASQNLTYDDLYGYGSYNVDYGFYFKRNSDGAETDMVAIGSTGAGLDEVIFDLDDPEFHNIMLTDETGAEMEINFEDYDEVIGTELTFSVYDENLATINQNGSEFDTDETTMDFDYLATWGVPAEISVIATDHSGRTSEASLTLIYPLQTTTATLTAANIYSGDEPNLTIDTLSDGKADASFEYRLYSEPDTAYSDEVPTAAGRYMVRATIPETYKYEEIICTDDFYIQKRTPSTAVVTVPDTLVGEEYEPELTTDSDGIEDATFDYKLSSAPADDYDDVMPESAGEYDVRATIPETDEYLGTVCYGTFKISKRPVNDAKVDIPDMNIGTDYEPTLTGTSDGISDASFAYKVSTAADTTYTAVKPTAAGTYTVRATIPETEIYLGKVCTDNFTIKKLIPTVKVICSDIKVGENCNPSVVTPSKGTVTYQYKKSGAADSTYTGEKPSEGGKYVVKATVAATAEYEAAVGTAEFNVSRLAPTSASVTVPDSKVGDVYEPVLTTDSDGKDKAVFEYKVTGDEDTTYSSVKPYAAGSYTIRATVPETGKYDEITCIGSFTISKKAPSYAEVSIDDIKAGTEFAPVLKTDSDGISNAEFFYKPMDAPDTAFSNVKPVTVGAYTVKAVIPETDTYTGISCEDTFNILIAKKDVQSIKVTVADVTVGTEYEPVLTTDSDGKDKAVFEYKPRGAADSAYTTTKPTAAGEYEIRATVPETEEYFSASAVSSFVISKREVTKAIVTQKDACVGNTLNPIVETDSDVETGIVFMYRPYDADEDSYSGYVPSRPGRYVVKALIPETSVYKAASCTDDFELSYLDAPGEAFTIQGTAGKNKYYTSDVYLKAPVGFMIAAEYGGDYGESVLYSKSLENIYLVRIDDGARTTAIPVKQEIKIDKVLPEFVGKTQVLSGENKFFSDGFELSVNDENLFKLFMDGLEMKVDKGTADMILDPANGIKTFSIKAEDEAGNTSEVEITIFAEWLKDKIIPADKLLPLDSKEAYKLDDGSWTVSGDGTVYNGGVSVYVNESGEYVFTRVD